MYAFVAPSMAMLGELAGILLVMALYGFSDQGPVLHVDRGDPAYTVFHCQTRAEQHASRELANAEGLQPCRDAAHLRRVLREVHTERVLREDFAASEVIEQLAAVLESQPGVPVGLTWNGGIAITSTDYRHAQRTFAQYQSKP